MKNLFYYETEIGKIGIGEENGAITDLLFGAAELPEAKRQVNIKESDIIKKAALQLYEYLEGKRKVFDLPVFAEGTVFQKLVWEALKTITYGETRSYKDIAIQIGKAKACRAVGMANNRNPLPIIVPCHRVIGAKGQLVGYGGGLDIKMKLLDIEGIKTNNTKVIT